jgi:hypothetical protein
MSGASRWLEAEAVRLNMPTASSRKSDFMMDFII